MQNYCRHCISWLFSDNILVEAFFCIIDKTVRFCLRLFQVTIVSKLDTAHRLTIVSSMSTHYLYVYVEALDAQRLRTLGHLVLFFLVALHAIQHYTDLMNKGVIWNLFDLSKAVRSVGYYAWTFEEPFSNLVET